MDDRLPTHRILTYVDLRIDSTLYQSYLINISGEWLTTEVFLNAGAHSASKEVSFSYQGFNFMYSCDELLLLNLNF